MITLPPRDTHQARCENFESTETAASEQPIFSNSLCRSENAMISVGQTKVQSRG